MFGGKGPGLTELRGIFPTVLKQKALAKRESE